MIALGWTAEQERRRQPAGKKGPHRARPPRAVSRPSGLPQGGRWSPGEFLALSTLMGDRGDDTRFPGQTPSTGTAGPIRSQPYVRLQQPDLRRPAD